MLNKATHLQATILLIVILLIVDLAYYFTRSLELRPLAIAATMVCMPISVILAPRMGRRRGCIVASIIALLQIGFVVLVSVGHSP